MVLKFSFELGIGSPVFHKQVSRMESTWESNAYGSRKINANNDEKFAYNVYVTVL